MASTEQPASTQTRASRYGRNKKKEAQQESQIIILLIFAYIISYFIHAPIIAYFHLMFYPFLFGIQLLTLCGQNRNNNKNRVHRLQLLEFPILVHVLIAMYILWFKHDAHFFSLCWTLSVGFCAFRVLLDKNIIYLDLQHFFAFYTNYSPLLLMHVLAHYANTTHDDDNGNTAQIAAAGKVLYAGHALLISSLCWIAWSLFNILFIKLAISDSGELEQLPFMQLSRVYTHIFCPLHLKYVNASKLHTVYAFYVVIGLCYLWIVAGISMYIHQYYALSLLFVVALFLFCCVQGFRLFLAKLDQEIKLNKRKKTK